MMDQENQPLLSPAQKDTDSNFRLRRCGGQVCQQYKGILLILLWTMIVSEFPMFQQGVIGGFIDNYVPIGNNHFANAVSSPLAFVYAILAVIAMFYPLGGFLADVCCGRFKTVMIGLGFLLFFFVIVITFIAGYSTMFQNAHPLLEQYSFKEVAPFYIVGFGTLCLVALGVVAFQANFIQLGLDQLMDAPSKHLSIFVHVAIWADTLGATITAIGAAFVTCPAESIKIKIASCTVPLLTLIIFPFSFILACCKQQWFYTEPGHRNPY